MTKQVELDAIDLKILRELQRDGRMTNVDLAQRVGISAPPCLRRVRKLEETGVIKGYHALLNAPALGFDLANWAAALITLSLYAAAFYAEVFRGGIVSIDKGQSEAGAAIGMSGWQVMRRIVLPQAIRRMMPAFINQSVTQFKNTSLISVISVAELTYMASIVNGQTYRPLEAYTVLALLYFAILFPIMKFADIVESRTRGSH